METQWKLSNKYFILLFALFSFTIAKTQYDFDYYLPTTELNTITSDIAYSDLSLSSGEYLVIYGQGNTSGKIKKPFIIVEGFDMFDDQRIQNYIDLYNNNSSIFFLYELYTQGYDVIILDFDNAVDYIQNNAMLVVKLIEEVNA